MHWNNILLYSSRVFKITKERFLEGLGYNLYRYKTKTLMFSLAENAVYFHKSL